MAQDAPPQTIQSIAEEAAEQQRAADKAAFQEFLAQWELEDIPACPIGMGLLFDFAQAHPGAYAMVLQQSLLATPRLANNARWQIYATHLRICHNCNASGDNFHP